MANFKPSNPYKNIILVGVRPTIPCRPGRHVPANNPTQPGGSLGSVLLSTLLSEPTFTVSTLVRESSKSIASLSQHGNLKVIKIADDYPYADIVAAFQGQDAVVNAITSTEVQEQFKFVDAAVEAGIKRYVPSEYGLNNLRPEARALNAVFGMSTFYPACCMQS